MDSKKSLIFFSRVSEIACSLAIELSKLFSFDLNSDNNNSSNFVILFISILSRKPLPQQK